MKKRRLFVNQPPHPPPPFGTRIRTRRLGFEHPGGETGPAETHSVQSQDAEGVVDVRRQLEVDRGLGPGDLGEVVPVAPVVQRVLVLDQKFCRKQVGGWETGRLITSLHASTSTRGDVL